MNIEDKRAEDHEWLVDGHRSLDQLVKAWDYYLEMKIFTSHLIEAKCVKDKKQEG